MKKRLFLASAAAALMGTVPAGHAQTGGSFPQRPVKIVVPYPAGSGPDQLARVLAHQLQTALRQSFFIENRAGALGVVGTGEVARAAPDGYTLLLTTNTTQAANVALVRNLQYDPVRDFVPIIRVAVGPMMLLVPADSSYTSVSDLMRNARAAGKPLSVGFGSAASQVSAAKLAQGGKLDVVNVPYKGIPAAVNDLLGGHLALTFADLPVALPLVRSGRVRALGVTSATRLTTDPNIPTLAEFIPGYEVIGWQGLVAPAGTPDAVVQRLDTALMQALREPDLIERLRSMHHTVAPLSSKPFGDFIVSEIARWKDNAQQAGIRPE